MASFETHLVFTTVITGVVTIPLLSAGMVNSIEGISLLCLGVIGGMLPDVDSDHSIPIQITYKVISLILPLILIFNFANELPLLQILFAWIISTLVFYIIFTYIFLPLTVHRGVFHTLAMGIVSGELTSLFMIYGLDIADKIALLSGIYVAFGFFLHLLLDEIYSVNLLGVSLKRSFGSAFKIYDSGNIIGSIIINLMAVALFFTLPNMNNIFKDLLDLLQNIAIY